MFWGFRILDALSEKTASVSLHKCNVFLKNHLIYKIPTLVPASWYIVPMKVLQCHFMWYMSSDVETVLMIMTNALAFVSMSWKGYVYQYPIPRQCELNWKRIWYDKIITLSGEIWWVLVTLQNSRQLAIRFEYFARALLSNSFRIQQRWCPYCRINHQPNVLYGR